MLSRLLLALVRSYQLLISPWLGDCCRFEPSCSRYASACLEHHGALRGSWLTFKRLLRCNPFFVGGVDMPPLPDGADLRAVEPDWARLSQRIDRASWTVRRENLAQQSSSRAVGHSASRADCTHANPLVAERVQPSFSSTTEL